MKTFVEPEFWSDPSIEELGPDEKLSILWVLTNPRCNLCGFTEVSRKRFHFETGLEPEVLRRACEALGKGFEFPAKGFVWARNYVGFQFGRGPNLARNNMAKSIVKHLIRMPESLQSIFLEEYQELKPLMEPLASPSQGLSKGKGNGKSKGNQTSKEKDIPNLEQVIEYLTPKMAEIHSGWTPTRVRKAAKLRLETFTDAGWKDGNGSPIKNWKTKFMNCMKHEKPWNYEDLPEGSTPITKPTHDPGPEGWQKAHQELYPDWLVPFEWFHVELWLRDEIQAHLNDQ